MVNIHITGFPSASVLRLTEHNYVVNVRKSFNSHKESQVFVNRTFEALITQHPKLEYAYIYIYLNGDCRYFHKARQLRCSSTPVKIMPNLALSNELTESYFKVNCDSEIRYFFTAHKGTYKCLGASWDVYGSVRANLPDAKGKLLCGWDTEISAARLDLLTSCDSEPGRWQSNGYHYPNKPTWALFDKAQAIIPRGFEFSQTAIKVKNAAIVDDAPADYVVIVKDAPRYAKQQRAFWESVKP